MKSEDKNHCGKSGGGGALEIVKFQFIKKMSTRQDRRFCFLGALIIFTWVREYQPIAAVLNCL